MPYDLIQEPLPRPVGDSFDYYITPTDLLQARQGWRLRVTRDFELIRGDVGVDASEHTSWEVRGYSLVPLFC